jgi:uncharacterized membrane protein
MSNPGQESPDNETLRDLNENVKALSKSLNKAAKSSEKYSDATLGFTLILFLVAFLQLLVTIQTLNKPWYVEVILIVLFSLVVLFSMSKVFGWIDEKHKD